MNPWRRMFLGEIAESVDYGVTASASRIPTGPKFLRITDIQNGSVNWDTVPWCECDARVAAGSRLEAGDIVFARTGATTGKSFLISTCPKDAVFASYLIRVRMKDGVDPRYVSTFFQSEDYWAQITKGARGAAQPGVNATTLKALEIPIPPLPEQRRIAAILDQADALRAKRREALVQLDSLTQSIFIEMFGDPVHGDGRFPISTIEDIAASEKYSIVDGPFGSSMKPDDYRESGIPVVRIANITKQGEFFKKNLLFIDKFLFEKLKRSSIKPRDVLVSRVGTLGNTCVFPDGIGDALLSTTGVCKIQPNASRILPEFLHQAILQPTFQEQIQRSASTSVQKYFNLSALKGWQIVEPPLAEQRKFVVKLTAVGELRSAQLAALAELDTLFASLQHRAFRGEL